MVRINLLPGEILEKRKFEHRIRYIAIAGALVAVVLVGVYSFLMFQVTLKRGDLQDWQQAETELKTQAEAFKVFEEKESALRTRQELAEQALDGRVNWGRLANELSLVMPSEVWLSQLTANEESGINLTAFALDSPDDVPDVGHKAVAKTLIRLADLEMIDDVWLTASTKATFLEQPAITFQVVTGVVVPGSEVTDESAVPAPPEPAE